MSSQRMRTARLAVMTSLSEDIGETVNLTVPDRNAMIYLDRVESKWPLRVQFFPWAAKYRFIAPPAASSISVR